MKTLETWRWQSLAWETPRLEWPLHSHRLALRVHSARWTTPSPPGNAGHNASWHVNGLGRALHAHGASFLTGGS